MKPFNREKFLLWLLAALLGWQASLFTYGTVMCANVKSPQTVKTACPDLADNYNKFVQTTLGLCLAFLQAPPCLNQDVPNSPYGYAEVSIIRESPLSIVL